MEDFDCRKVDRVPLKSRFPPDAVGAAQWREIGYRGTAPPAGWIPASMYGDPPKQHFDCPCVFISHRHADTEYALRIAELATRAGFYYWLDELDLVPGPPLLLAGIIEMALLNSTHVIAVLTRRTRGSLWVPYEYGRVKDELPLSDQAGCWLHPGIPAEDVPEYVWFGVVTRREEQITDWLDRQMTEWRAAFGRCDGGRRHWTGEPTEPLPLADPLPEPLRRLGSLLRKTLAAG